VATIDGPPPLAVQAEVADLIYSWFNPEATTSEPGDPYSS
jgi:hypothetical protein